MFKNNCFELQSQRETFRYIARNAMQTNSIFDDIAVLCVYVCECLIAGLGEKKQCL